MKLNKIYLYILIGIVIGVVAGVVLKHDNKTLITPSTLKVVNASGQSDQATAASSGYLGQKSLKASPGADFEKMINNSNIKVE